MSDPTYYETMYILRPDIPEDEVDSHLKKYSEVLEKAKAQVVDNQMRGKRRLAYTIGKYKEGIYVQLSHQGDGKQVESLEKAMRLSEDIIRYLTVKQYGSLPAKRAPKTSEKDMAKTSEEKVNTEAKEEKTNESQEKIKKEEKTEPTKEASKEEPAKEEPAQEASKE